MRSFDARLRPLGFAMSQLPVLRALADGSALPQKELVRLARVEQATMAEMLARMERGGVVERQPNPDDGRGTLVSLTRQSRKRLPRAKEVLVEADEAALDGFSDAERALLRELLQRLVRNLEGRREP